MAYTDLPDCAWCGHEEKFHHAVGPCLVPRCACEMYEHAEDEYIFG
jgi:hypothetical protein